MDLEFRQILPTDESLSSEQAAFLSNARTVLWVCTRGARWIGHCVGNPDTGEILGLTVDEELRRQGIGRRLLGLVVDSLRAAGLQRIWLDAPAPATAPAYGFYRALGWRPTGTQTQGEPYPGEILELPVQDSLQLRGE